MNCVLALTLLTTLAATTLSGVHAAPAVRTELSTTERAGDAAFSYNPSAADGPPNWASLDDSFATCSSGSSQSPINVPCPAILPIPEPLLGAPSISSATASMNLQSTTLNFELACPAGGNCGSTRFGGTDYDLVNIHFHSLSEHHIDGQAFPLEAHMVHASSSGQLLVISVMFSQGGSDDCLTKAPQSSGDNPTVQAILTRLSGGFADVSVDTASFLEDNTLFSTYPGSLTTPPCSEGVTWLMASTRQSVSNSQVQQFLQLTNSQQYGNARPVQPLNSRNVAYAPLSILL